MSIEDSTVPFVHQGENDSQQGISIDVALSGGGIRSASFCAGVLSVLDKITKIRFVSCVSGGGYAGSAYVISKHKSPNTKIYSDVWDRFCENVGYILNFNWLSRRMEIAHIAGLCGIDLKNHIESDSTASVFVKIVLFVANVILFLADFFSLLFLGVIWALFLVLAVFPPGVILVDLLIIFEQLVQEKMFSSPGLSWFQDFRKFVFGSLLDNEPYPDGSLGLILAISVPPILCGIGFFLFKFLKSLIPNYFVGVLTETFRSLFKLSLFLFAMCLGLVGSNLASILLKTDFLNTMFDSFLVSGFLLIRALPRGLVFLGQSTNASAFLLSMIYGQIMAFFKTVGPYYTLLFIKIPTHWKYFVKIGALVLFLLSPGISLLRHLLLHSWYRWRLSKSFHQGGFMGCCGFSFKQQKQDPKFVSNFTANLWKSDPNDVNDHSILTITLSEPSHFATTRVSNSESEKSDSYAVRFDLSKSFLPDTERSINDPNQNGSSTMANKRRSPVTSHETGDFYFSDAVAISGAAVSYRLGSMQQSALPFTQRAPLLGCGLGGFFTLSKGEQICQYVIWAFLCVWCFLWPVIFFLLLFLVIGFESDNWIFIVNIVVAGLSLLILLIAIVFRTFIDPINDKLSEYGESLNNSPGTWNECLRGMCKGINFILRYLSFISNFLPLIQVFRSVLDLFDMGTRMPGKVNVTDGGHTENLGLFYLLAEKSLFMVCVDGSEDSGKTCSELKLALQNARKCLGCKFSKLSDGSDAEAAIEQFSHFLSERVLVLRVQYPESNQEGTLVYLKPTRYFKKKRNNSQGQANPQNQPTAESEFQTQETMNHYLNCWGCCWKSKFLSKLDKFPNHPTMNQFWTKGLFDAYFQEGKNAAAEALESGIFREYATGIELV